MDTYTTESKSYNTNGQLASLNFSGGVNGGIQYNYSATQNNGQITQAVDTISGETISYQYDQLKRLTSASSTPGTGSTTAAWAEGFQYDGFGNLTQKTLNGTAGPIPVNAATNQLTNASYDLNGNMWSGAGATLTYDVSNRPTSAVEVSGSIEYYGYAADNKQVYRLLPNGNEEFTFYGAQGEKLGVYGTAVAVSNGPPYYSFTYSMPPLRSNIYFAGKMIWSDNVAAYRDRLGTNRANGARFYPFGDEITSTSNDREKFATYTRDSYTGLDYADQRYFASTYGRFNTPDLTSKGMGLSEPESFNRYSYVLGDPINKNDPRGRCAIDVTSGTVTSGTNGYDDCLYDLDLYGNLPDIGFDTMIEAQIANAIASIYNQLAAAPLPQPTCSISLEERPVGGIAGALGADHTYLYVQGPAGIVPPQGSETIEGGPDFVDLPIGYLVSTVSSPPGNGLAGTLPGGPGNVQVGTAFSGSVACSDIQTITSKLAHYGPALGNAAVYNPTPALGPGYNSNSFTYTLLYDVGLSTFFGSPSSTPGWGYLVPGLQ